MPADPNAEPVDPIKSIGDDATATFDDSPSNPTEHASNEALDEATNVEGEGDPVSRPESEPKPSI